MSVTIKIFGEHGLKIDDYENAVATVERALECEVSDISNIELQSSKANETVQYYANHAFFSDRFKEDKELYIMTTHPFCKAIRIYKHFIQFYLSGNLNLKYDHWQNFVSFSEKEDFKNEEGYLEWRSILDFISKSVIRFQGNSILFINDGFDFASSEELILEGKDFITVVDSLKNISESKSYNDLEKGKIARFANNNWYLKKVR